MLKAMAAGATAIGIRNLVRGGVVIGGKDNFWIWSDDKGYDLTHPKTIEEHPISDPFRFRCETTHVTVDPAKTALVIIDMQNLFLSKALGRDSKACQQAEHCVLTKAIPAARKAKIRIAWLTWGLTQEDLDDMPPTFLRVWGFRRGAEVPSGHGMGAEMDPIELENGQQIRPGKMLFRDQWNTDLHGGLKEAFEEGRNLERPDVRFHKNRDSGMCSAMTDCTEFFHKEGIQTLLFAGVNTDQCVLATLTDASLQGFDSILLKDGCATTSPDYAQKSAEYDCNWSWGFVSSCESLKEATDHI